jgi:hypothetical protein
MLIAYIGPGLGGGVIAVVVGILVALSLALFSYLMKPIRRVISFLESKDHVDGE